MEKIIRYLNDKYNPEAIIVYGSFANNTQDSNSDFDALVVTKETCVPYDNSIVDNTLLDVFIYQLDELKLKFNPEDFVMIFDGNVILDKNGYVTMMKQKVLEYIDNFPKVDKQELEHLVTWCEKMLERAKRNDAEGFYRWHWVLVDSLKIYFDCISEYYFGPKKSLELLKKRNLEVYTLYQNALISFNMDELSCWIQYLRSII